MKRSFLSPILGLAVLAAAWGPRAVAQSDSSRAWEYRVFSMDVRDFADKDDWKETLKKNDGNELRADAEFKAYVLDSLGKDGWELVQVVQPIKEKNSINHFYMKRPKR